MNALSQPTLTRPADSGAELGLKRPVAADPGDAAIDAALASLQHWIEARDYAGHEPYDILNSRLLPAQVFALRPLSWGLIQAGKYGGSGLRWVLRVPVSKNPKALGLMLAGYCDQLKAGADSWPQMNYLKRELRRLRNPGEECFCWGYDWNFVSLRGPVLPSFTPNAIATVFCGSALLDMAEAGDQEAGEMAESAGRFLVTRLNRPVDTELDLCFSYTPWNRSRIFNSSALTAAFLTRLAMERGRDEYLPLARRAMHYLARAQRTDGAWFYGAGRSQRWIDGFHTGYNLEALLTYRQVTGDGSFDDPIRRGYDFYLENFFTIAGAPKYFHNRLYPIDIHSCSQAILTFCAFQSERTEAREKALQAALWTLGHMRGSEDCFIYQQHRWWRDGTPYMRWGQAWMFRALARLQRTLWGSGSTSGAVADAESRSL